MVPRLILFVDDYEMLRKIYVEILSEAGYRIQDASSAEECMSSLAQEIPDLILLDIMMKPVDGWATLLQIRDHLPSAGVPVIMISGKAILPQEISQYGPFIDGYLRKPLQNVTLLNSISAFFDWFDLLREVRDKALVSGKDPELVESYFKMRREYRSISQMYQMVQHEYDKTRDSLAADILTEAFAEIEHYIESVAQKLKYTEGQLGVSSGFDS